MLKYFCNLCVSSCNLVPNEESPSRLQNFLCGLYYNAIVETLNGCLLTGFICKYYTGMTMFFWTK